jgi:molecular chaperone DnaK
VHVYARQIGTTNEAEAEFDSRTGESKGWTSYVLKEEPVEAVVKNKTDKPQIVIPVAKFPFQKSKGVVNGLIIKAKEMLSVDPDGPVALRLEELLEAYIELLMKSKQGAKNDKEIERLEFELIECMSKE